jgi:hypothetical protein
MDESDPKYGPTYITITEQPARSVIDMVEEEDGGGEHHKRRHPDLKKLKKQIPPTNKELDAVEGSIEHVMRDDGEVNICIRASFAGGQNPMRFGLRVEEEEEEKERELVAAQTDPSLGADHHLSFMEDELNRIELSMHGILREADFAKERDSLFHKQFNRMHSATFYWPIIHACIIVVAGFTQANHIVRFFKSRRII